MEIWADPVGSSYGPYIFRILEHSVLRKDFQLDTLVKFSVNVQYKTNRKAGQLLSVPLAG